LGDQLAACYRRLLADLDQAARSEAEQPEPETSDPDRNLAAADDALPTSAAG
jgi:hypothetical protein